METPSLFLAAQIETDQNSTPISRVDIVRGIAAGRSLRASAIHRWAQRVRASLSALIRPRPAMRRKRRAF